MSSDAHESTSTGSALFCGTGADRVGLATILRTALVVWGALVFFTAFDIFAFEIYSAPRPAYWVYGYCIAAAALILLQREWRTSLHRSPLVVWICLFLMVTMAWSIGISSSSRAFQALVDRGRSIAFLAACVLVFDQPRARRLGVMAVAGAILASSLLNVAEFLRIVELPSVAEYPRVPGRAAGFYGDANAAGQCIALGLAIAVPAVRSSWRVPLLMIGAAGVFATFSRSAVVCMVPLLIWLVWRRLLGAGQLALITLCAVAVASLGIGYIRSHDLLTDNTASRLAGEADDSGRVALALEAFEMFARSPLVGQGLGSTNAWQSPQLAHNIYLALAADYGILGLLAFPALGIALAVGNRQAVGFSIVLMIAGAFSHTVIDGRPYMFLVALAAASARAPATASAEPENT